MKAILNQWVGRFNGSAGAQTKPGATSEKPLNEAAAPEEQSFMGLMMGFLGMNSQHETQEKSAAGAQKNLTGESQPGSSKSDAGNSNIVATEDVPIQTAPANTVLSTDSSPVATGSSTEEKDPSSTKIAGLKSTAKTGLQNTAMISVDGSKASQLTSSNKPLDDLTSKMSDNFSQPALGQSAGSADDEKPTWVGSKISELESGTQKKGTANIKPGTLLDDETLPETGAKGKRAILDKASSGASEKKETGKLPSLIEDQKNVTKGEKKKKLNLRGNDKTQANHDVEQTHAQKKRPAPESLTSGNKNVFKQSAPAKPSSGSPVAAPGELVASKAEEIDIQLDFDATKEQGTESETRSKEFTLSNFKSAHISEAAGRKSFSRQLAQVSRQQFSQTQGSSRQNGSWKHHRFVLKDGSSIHIAARSADGGLQLQLNAGNGELGKIIQQHLAEIQQHVQQELNIKIDLQLQNSGGRNAGDQPGTSSESQANSSPSGGRNSDTNPVTGTSASRPHVRYLGFNQNEWTA